MDVQSRETFWALPEPHKAARPMKVVVDKDGCSWLCDADVDVTENLKDQGCWNCKDVAFTRDD